MAWFYLILIYLVLTLILVARTRDLRKSAVRGGLIFFGGWLLFNLFNPSGIDFRRALIAALGLLCLGGWVLFASLLSYDDALQERWDEAQVEPSSQPALEEVPIDEDALEQRTD